MLSHLETVLTLLIFKCIHESRTRTFLFCVHVVGMRGVGTTCSFNTSKLYFISLIAHLRCGILKLKCVHIYV